MTSQQTGFTGHASQQQPTRRGSRRSAQSPQGRVATPPFPPNVRRFVQDAQSTGGRLAAFGRVRRARPGAGVSRGPAVRTGRRVPARSDCCGTRRSRRAMSPVRSGPWLPTRSRAQSLCSACTVRYICFRILPITCSTQQQLAAVRRPAPSVRLHLKNKRYARESE